MLLEAVGRIRTPYRSLAECPGSAAEAVGTSTIEIYPSYADALDGIEAATHLILMYWLGQADRTRLRSATRVDW
jgi:tRNA (adenine37-N6)-methyltransferase